MAGIRTLKQDVTYVHGIGNIGLIDDTGGIEGVAGGHDGGNARVVLGHESVDVGVDGTEFPALEPELAPLVVGVALQEGTEVVRGGELVVQGGEFLVLGGDIGR